MDDSEGFFKEDLFEIFKDLILIINDDYRIKYSNKEKFLGYPRKDILNNKFISLIKNEDIDKFTNFFSQIPDPSPHSLKINLKSKSGRLLPYKIKFSQLKNQRDYLLYLRKRPKILKTKFDVQKNARSILESIIETTSDAIIISDIQSNIIYTSEKALKLSGFKSKNAFIGKDSFQFIHPEERAKAMENLKRTIEDGKIEGAKYRFVKKDGTYYHGELNASLIKDSKNNPIGFIGIIKDITERELAQEKVKASEEKYRNMINNLDLGFFRIKWNGKVLDCNSAFKKILEIPPDREIDNFNSLDFLQISEERKKFFQILINNEKVSNYRIHTKPVYGNEKIVQLNSYLIRDNNGEPSIIEGTITDITEKYVLEEKLRESERKYHTLFDGANDAIFIMDKNIFIECNEKTLEIFGCDKESDILGKSPWIFSPEKQPDGLLSMEKAYKYINNALRGEPQRFYWKHIKKDGTPFDAEISLNRFILGKKIFIQAIVRDTSSQMKAERDLKNSEQKYRHLFENSPFPIALLSPKGEIVDFNSATTTLLDYAREELIGKNYVKLSIIEKEFMEELFEWRNRFLRGETISPIEVSLKKKDASTVWVEVEASKVKVGNKDLIQVIGHNVTERKKAENLIKEEFKKLKDLDQMRKDLISRVSHELKTPLMSIDGASELLIMQYKENLEKEALSLLKMIEKGGKRLNDLVNNLLDISRIEYKSLELDKDEHNLSEIIKEITQEIKPIAKKRDIIL
jgi:PAS domain S-box-containing protein